jgi:hypothetical protein
MAGQSQKAGTNRAALLSPHFGPNAAKSANSFAEGRNRCLESAPHFGKE